MVSLFKRKNSVIEQKNYVQTGFSYDYTINQPQKTNTIESISIDQLPHAQGGATSTWQNTWLDGDKFDGGFGTTQLFTADYWTLRQRSVQLFEENIYARGLLRRFVVNEINTGLTPDVMPDGGILDIDQDELYDWSDNVESRFAIWSKNPRLCDWNQQNTFGAIQRMARLEALISGDVLIVLRHSPLTRLPMIQLISGSNVQTPLIDAKIAKGHEVKHGVEFNTQGRVVAYWTLKSDGVSKRIPAVGSRSGRKKAWLVFGTDKKLDDVRGQPLLSIVLQSLKELDRYRDAATRKAVLNSILAMFVKKTQDKPGTNGITRMSAKNTTATVADSNGDARNFNIASQVPGMVIEELQQGEEPVGFDSKGIDVSFGQFEEAIINAVAWCNYTPPEILRLAFSNNYSASQAAINEYKIYLNMRWSEEGENLCTPIYIDWLTGEILSQKIEASDFLLSMRDQSMYDIFGAWTSVDWYGSIKSSTDMLKQAKGSQILVQEAWSSNAREARMLTGTKFERNVKKLIRENKAKAEAARPLLELEKEFGSQQVQQANQDIETVASEVVQLITDNGELKDNG